MSSTDTINIITAVVSLIVTGVGVWIAYLTLLRTPKPDAQSSESQDKHKAGIRKSVILILFSTVAAMIAATAFASSPLMDWVRRPLNLYIGEAILAAFVLTGAAILLPIIFQRRRPLIAVQTDYGTRSPYIGALVGAIYGVDPFARVQMITAEVDSYDRVHAAWVLRLASEEYPKGTIFVCVTNPGGITTQPSIIETRNGHIYIGHDNGLFDLVVKDYGFSRYYLISGQVVSKPRYESLFGISLFAPTAAYISKGVRLSKLGTRLLEYQYKLNTIHFALTQDAIEATVMDIDKFGNSTLNVRECDLEALGVKLTETFCVEIQQENVNFDFRETYGYVSVGDPVAIIFLGYVQLAIRQQNFAEKYKMKRGDKVVVKKLHQK